MFVYVFFHILLLHLMYQYEFHSTLQLICFCKKSDSVWTAYGDMHLKDFLGSIARVGCYIHAQDLYLMTFDAKKHTWSLLDPIFIIFI